MPWNPVPPVRVERPKPPPRPPKPPETEGWAWRWGDRFVTPCPGLKDFDAVQKRELLKMLIRRVELTPDGIVLNPFDGEPIVGEVQERKGVRSGRWRFIEVEWLN